MCKFLQSCLSHFPQLILGGENEYVSQHTIENCSACVNVHNSREGQILVSNKKMDGYMDSSSSESLQELVRASSASMLVTSRAGMRNRTSRDRLPI